MRKTHIALLVLFILSVFVLSQSPFRVAKASADALTAISQRQGNHATSSGSLAPRAQTEFYGRKTKQQVGSPSAATDSGTIPHLSEYSHLLTSHDFTKLQEFLSTSPDCDLTDQEQFHQLQIDKRATLPSTLSDAASDTHNQWLLAVESLQQSLVTARAAFLGIATAGTTPEGNSYSLTGFDAASPHYVYTTNVAATETTAVDLVRLNPTYLNASGSDVYVNINDNQTILEHTEFQLPSSGGSRILLKETGTGSGVNHSTHITGTVAAWGYNANLIGMAPRAWIRGHNGLVVTDITAFGARWPGQSLDGTTLNPRNNALQRRSVTGAAPLGTGFNNGVYTTTCATFDNALRDTPYFLQFYAANNLGNTTTANYFSLGGNHPACKNIITVGSITDMIRDASGGFDYAPSSGGILSDFSSRGPTFDGRIKPDFTVNGHLITSTSGTNSSEAMSGTSQATANAAGTATLVIDYINKVLPGHFFRSSTVKALLVNTATGLGTAEPDYQYGWGAMNAKAACDTVKSYAENPSTRTIVEDELSASQTWTRTYNNPGTGTVRLTLTWLDPAGATQTSTSTDRSARLVNDLNVRLISSSGTIYLPWVMPYTTGNGTLPAFDPGLYGAAAVPGNNDRDNVEQVFAANVPAGNYTVQITHAGSLRDGAPQPFSLVLARLTATSAPAPVVSSVSFPNASPAVNSLPITAQGSGFVLGANMFLRRTIANGTQQTVQGYGVMPSGNQITARFDAATLTPGYWDVVVINPGGVEAVLPNGYLIHLPGGTPRRFDLYRNNFEGSIAGFFFDPAFPGWAVAPPNKGAVSGPATAQQGNKALVTNPGGNYPANFYTYMNLPSISTVGYTDIRLSFQRWLGVANDEATIRFFVNGGGTNAIATNYTLLETGWGLQNYNLSSAANGADSITIEFYISSDGSAHSFGWNIDDLVVSGVASYALPPLITSGNPPTAGQHTPYSATITATDEDTAVPSRTFTATGLPAGLSIATNGTITGTPTTIGTTNFTVSVTDGIYTTHKNFTLTTITALAKWRTDNALPADGTGTGANLADPDSDTVENLLEYAFGSNPNSSTGDLAYTTGGAVTTPGKPIARNLAVGSGVDYRAIFTRRKDRVAANLTYTVQFSAGLDIWVNSTATPTVLTGADGANPAAVEAVYVPYPLLISVNGASKKPTFFRVVVTLNP
jgi:hypothetical protein